jgi:hypothetical protein
MYAMSGGISATEFMSSSVSIDCDSSIFSMYVR